MNWEAIAFPCADDGEAAELIASPAIRSAIATVAMSVPSVQEVRGAPFFGIGALERRGWWAAFWLGSSRSASRTVRELVKRLSVLTSRTAWFVCAAHPEPDAIVLYAATL